MYKILLVEDEKRMRESIADYLSAKGLVVSCCENGLEALEVLAYESFDVVLLDVMMPKLDGFSVCQALRRQNETPIIFITARSDEEDFLYGYKLGADDYVAKPFSLSVLYAKCMALIKRDKGIVVDERMISGGICIDCRTHQVYVQDEEVKLTPIAYKILLYLMQHPNQVITREQLLVKVWGYDYEGNDRVIDGHIKKLRKSLGAEGKSIQTVITVGYKFKSTGSGECEV